MRDVTKRAGVSSAAAYRHFPSRQAVLDEVARAGFSLLAERTRRRMARCIGAGRVVAAGRAYVDFARVEPRLFALMFGSEGAGGRASAAASQNADEGKAPSASEQLRRAVSDVGARADEATLLHAWALAHGLAALASSGAYRGSASTIGAVLEQFAAHLVATESASPSGG